MKWLPLTIAFPLMLGACASAPEPAESAPVTPTPDAEPEDPTLSALSPLTRELAFQIPGRDFRKDPPHVQTMDVIALPGTGESRLEVRYAEPMPSQVKFSLEGNVVLLRDDGKGVDRQGGDGTYSAALPAPPAEAESWNAPLAAPSGMDKERSLMVRDLIFVNDPGRTSDPCLSTSSTATADLNKKWTFGYLLTHMANTSVTGNTFTSTQLTNASTFATAWLTEWAQDPKSINGDRVIPFGFGGSQRKVAAEALRQWRCASGMSACCINSYPHDDQTTPFPLIKTGEKHGDFVSSSPAFQACEMQAAGRRLAMNKAPFRLLAIVNRLDLRNNLGFGEGLAGELRFVFSILDLERREEEVVDGTDPPEFTMQGCAGRHTIDALRAQDNDRTNLNGVNTVILEYAVDKQNPQQVKDYANQWLGISFLPSDGIGIQMMRDRLQAITESVVRAGIGAPRNRGNGSELMQIRTNESPDNADWQLREFAISNGKLHGVTIKQTPSRLYAGTASQVSLLAQWINNNQNDIIAEKYKVPDSLTIVLPSGLPGKQPVLGGESTHAQDAFWTLAGKVKSREARHKFSLNTCNGCHSGEGLASAQLDGWPGFPMQAERGFAHVRSRLTSRPAELSHTLLGDGAPVIDPTDPMTPCVDSPNGLCPTFPTHSFHALDDRVNDMDGVLSGTALTTLSFQPSHMTH